MLLLNAITIIVNGFLLAYLFHSLWLFGAPHDSNGYIAVITIFSCAITNSLSVFSREVITKKSFQFYMSTILNSMLIAILVKWICLGLLKQSCGWLLLLTFISSVFFALIPVIYRANK